MPRRDLARRSGRAERRRPASPRSSRRRSRRLHAAHTVEPADVIQAGEQGCAH